MKTILKRLFKFSSSAKVTVFCLLLMAIIVIWGTLYEAGEGVLAAQEHFFQSWVFWTANVIPFPGIKLISVVLLWNLIVRSMLFFKHPVKYSGLIIMHLGVAFLLMGALFSSRFSSEYFLPLTPGESSGNAYSYEAFELIMHKNFNATDFTGNPLDSIPVKGLKKGQTITLSGKSFTVESVNKIKTPGHQSNNKAADVQISLVSENQCTSQNSNKLTVTSGFEPVGFLCDQDRYFIGIRPSSVQLPVTITLLDFDKQLHQGTGTLKSVQSHVSVKNESNVREAIISMNKPLRQGVYTFYQASYSEQNGKEISSFSVVYNPFKLFPYIASLTIVGGFLLHFIIVMFRKKREMRSSNAAK